MFLAMRWGLLAAMALVLGCGSVNAGKTLQRRQPVNPRDPMLATKTIGATDARQRAR